MKLLVATPYMSAHYDAGLFWVRAICNLGHTVSLWDYRLQAEPPRGESFDGSIVFKGENVNLDFLPRPAVCYYPDKFDRIEGTEVFLKKYDKVFTPVRPTPEWAEWLPSGYDKQIHRNYGDERPWDTLYVGTANSEYKISTVERISPQLVFGNSWQRSNFAQPPIYLHDLVMGLNRAKIIIDVHQAPDTGVNRKLFESIACGFTIVDRVPGIEDLFSDIYDMISFTTVEEATELISHYLRYPQAREELWRKEFIDIQRYSYYECARRVIQWLESAR